LFPIVPSAEAFSGPPDEGIARCRDAVNGNVWKTWEVLTQGKEGVAVVIVAKADRVQGPFLMPSCGHGPE